jgi:prepilin-type N-terminal cleavage/methylation domain-containing protein
MTVRRIRPGPDVRELAPLAGPGFTLFEVLVTVAILGVLSTVVGVSVETSSRARNRAERVDRAARVLDKLRDATVRVNLGTRGDTSFIDKISGSLIASGNSSWSPGRLSQLTTRIVAGTDKNGCQNAFTSLQVGNWTRNFYTQPVAFGGTLKLADGFVANDLMVRFDVTGVQSDATTNPPADVNKTPGTLAIVIPNVALADAQALAARMEGVQDPTSRYAVIRYVASVNPPNQPVTVYFHMMVHGC